MNEFSFRRLDKDAENEIRELFVSVFTREP